jgi:hypothetical protein
VVARQSGERRDNEQDISHERKKTREEGILLRCGLWTRAREKAGKRGNRNDAATGPGGSWCDKKKETAPEHREDKVSERVITK